MRDISLSCSCGIVQGVTRNITPRSGIRVVCCCDDCQAFASYLGRESEILDPHGGTDVFQMAPASIEIFAGEDQIRCIRFTRKGIYRWFADCCKTPIGNTMGAKMPFVGVVHSFMDAELNRDAALGPSCGTVQTHYAKNLPADAPPPVGFPLRITLRIMRKILGWKLTGKAKPTPFFNDDGTPISEPTIVNA